MFPQLYSNPLEDKELGSINRIFLNTYCMPALFWLPCVAFLRILEANISSSPVTLICWCMCRAKQLFRIIPRSPI